MFNSNCERSLSVIWGYFFFFSILFSSLELFQFNHFISFEFVVNVCGWRFSVEMFFSLLTVVAEVLKCSPFFSESCGIDYNFDWNCRFYHYALKKFQAMNSLKSLLASKAQVVSPIFYHSNYVRTASSSGKLPFTNENSLVQRWTGKFFFRSRRYIVQLMRAPKCTLSWLGLSSTERDFSSFHPKNKAIGPHMATSMSGTVGTQKNCWS